MKRIIFTANAPEAVGPYSQAVEANGLLFISGQVGIDPASGKIVAGGIKEQTRQILINTGEILKAAGYSYSNVVKTTCLLSDMTDFAAMNEEYARVYNVNPPARATFAVRELPLGVLVEIEAIATK